MSIAVIVPVAPYEPIEIVSESLRCLKGLNYGGLHVRIIYVIEKDGEDDKRIEILKKEEIEVMERISRKGKRAGNINHALELLKNNTPDYIAIFDIDSRPSKNFVIECIKALEKDEVAYIASSPRYISNRINLVSKTIDVEYHLINFLLKNTSFKLFNGLIGVLRAEFLIKNKLNEDSITEDADFTTYMHIMGYKALFTNSTKVYEQAPTTWRELLSQRIRWYYGGLQLWKYRKKVIKSGNLKFVLNWVLALTVPYVILLFSPLLLFAIIYRSIKILFGLALYALILQYAAINAIFKFIFNRGIEWNATKSTVKE